MRARLVRSIAAAVVLPTVLALGGAPAFARGGSPGGNNGTIKVSQVGGPQNTSNEPHQSCAFEVQWAGFDKGAGLYSKVSFAGQGKDKDIDITVMSGATKVFIGGDAAGGATDFDAKMVYRLAFDAPAGNPGKGYHVKVTTVNDGSHGAKTKFKVFHVKSCDPDAESTDPVEEPGEPEPDPHPPVPPGAPFDWNWEYDAPSCEALTVDYPANIPAGQANDVNVRFKTATGVFTLNFHNNTGTWSREAVFTFADHPSWPNDLSDYTVEWVQVGGTNYHWQGTVACGDDDVLPEPPPPFDWNWQYPTPTCTALNVSYPVNIPSGQANDANVRFESNLGQFTLNFHNNTGTWSGLTSFAFAQHPQWPAGVTSYRVVWTQVGGTNYHWQGNVACAA